MFTLHNFRYWRYWGLLSLVIGIFLLILVVSCSTAATGQREEKAPPPTAVSTVGIPKGVPKEFETLFEVLSALKQDHFNRESLDMQKLSRGAIRGMLQALEDPHAAYLDPQQYAVESQDFRGSFQGIGAEVTMRDGRIIIVVPLADTPAEKAGIRPGDVILEIDGQSTKGMSLLEAISRIRGVKGTSVNLVVLRRGERIVITIIRDDIKVQGVKLRMLTGGIAHLKITSFTETSLQQVTEAISRVDRLEARGLILDLRNNPGGLLSSVVDVTSHFLRSGLVLYEVDGRGRRTDWSVRPAGKARDIPLVVLVNEFSASGSEVMAGALKDHGRAPLVGVKTFGKGSVNTLRPLRDGSAVFFTTARWYTPSGTLIEGAGLEPDIQVNQPEDSKADLQLDKAIEVLESKLSKGN